MITETGMKMKQDENLKNYKTSTFKKLIRYFLRIAQQFLPNYAFNVLYDFLRSFHQRISQWVYVSRTIILQFSSDEQTILKHNLTTKLLPYTMGGWKAMHNAFDSVQSVEKLGIDGAIVECGVARGGTSAMMAMTNRAIGKFERKKWLFDSYEGLPAPGPLDTIDGSVGAVISPLGAGDCVGTEQEVKSLMFGTLGFKSDNTKIIKGWFNDTIPKMKKEVGAIAVLRLDGDWYESTRVPLVNFFDQVVEGGIIIIDDYATCYGSKLAVDEFIQKKKLGYELQSDGRGGAFFQKIAS